MALPLYLAKTDWEIPEHGDNPAYTAFMACHFSSYGDGLDFPPRLPRCAMVILNDRVPVWNHDSHKVVRQLQEAVQQAEADCVLLDLQRPGCPAPLLKELAALPCPVGVTEQYAQLCNAAVFSEVPMHRPLSDARSRWPGRELWLDVAGDTRHITVTAEGAAFTALPRQVPEGICHREERLHCSYHIEVLENRAEFTLFRTKEDMEGLLQEAEQLGFTRAVGLYQELKNL